MATSKIFSACNPVVARMALNFAQMPAQRPMLLRKQFSTAIRFPQKAVVRTAHFPFRLRVCQFFKVFVYVG
jgi:hypothetical protein